VKRIVIVEDNKSVAKFFRYVLERGDYAVAITESGEEAVELARQRETVAMLVDVSLRSTQYQGRYIDGLELSRIVKEDVQSSHVAVIIATAHVMSGDRERFLGESKADGFLRKPVIDPQELLSLVGRLTSPDART